MAKFDISVDAQVTIFEEDRFEIEADTIEEAEEKAQELFKMRMWEKYGWADYDSVRLTYENEGEAIEQWK